MHVEDVVPSALEVELIAKSGRFDEQDDRWAAQVSQLIRELRQEGASVRIDQTPIPGSKGGVEAVILTLGSAGAFTAAVEVFKAWLARDRTRSLSIIVQDGVARRRLVIRGTDLDREGFRELSSLAIRHGLSE